MDTCSIKVYGEMLKKVVVYDNCEIDIFLTCIPFGFNVKYHIHKYNRGHQFDVFIDACEAIPL